MNLHNVEFIKSAAKEADILKDGLPQIVFAGRSNVGKSSVINRILNRKNFARASSEPGKTAHINFFLIDQMAYFVDLPGYGYAKVSKNEKTRWGKLMEAYFSEHGHITAGVVIVDARHTPTKDDISMFNLFRETGCSVIVVANKVDKLKKSEIEPNKKNIREALGLPESVIVLPFSAEKGTGKEELIFWLRGCVV